jgi:hypothetical protein
MDGVHTGFWLSGTRSAVVPAIQAADSLPFSSKCQVKHTLVESGESVAGFCLRGVLSFPILRAAKEPAFARPFALLANGESLRSRC